VLATRGPLTERIIDRPGTAATDSAAFLSVLPQVVTMNPKPDLTLFMPHYHSTWGANWARAAEEAGMTFVDPQWPTARILELFSRAKLMVCEAMHGAIVADTLRIPWIPVGISREFLPLKWCDWAMSVDVPFRPTWLPASSYWEKVRFLKMKKEAEEKGLTLPDGSDFVTDPDELIADFRQRVGKEKPSEGAKYAAPSGARLILRDVSKYITWPLLGQAIKALKEASKGQPYLSPDAVFSSKVQKLVQAKDQFVETVRKG
jgi:succinoglycan biosynthesis protein ExoV